MLQQLALAIAKQALPKQQDYAAMVQCAVKAVVGAVITGIAIAALLLFMLYYVYMWMMLNDVSHAQAGMYIATALCVIIIGGYTYTKHSLSRSKKAVTKPFGNTSGDALQQIRDNVPAIATAFLQGFMDEPVQQQEAGHVADEEPCDNATTQPFTDHQRDAV